MVYPSVALAAGIVQKGLENLIKKIKVDNIDSLILSKDVNPKIVVNQVLQQIEKDGIIPIFTIDELDKITDDGLLSDFFEGQQGWFQGKRCLISLSHTYGQSLKNATIHSVKRFCAVQEIHGVTTKENFDNIIQKRFQLGISEIENNKKVVEKHSKNIITNHISTQIINNFTPHINLMLEEVYTGIKNALRNNSTILRIDDFPILNRMETEHPTELEQLILDELAGGKKQPNELATTLAKNPSVISRSLTKMKKSEWVGSEGSRTKNYFIKQKGEAARHR